MPSRTTKYQRVLTSNHCARGEGESTGTGAGPRAFQEYPLGWRLSSSSLLIRLRSSGERISSDSYSFSQQYPEDVHCELIFSKYLAYQSWEIIYRIIFWFSNQDTQADLRSFALEPTGPNDWLTSSRSASHNPVFPHLCPLLHYNVSVLHFMPPGPCSVR